MKKEKGITLAALVITIIVLLVLAGVSLNLISGSNSILGKAKEAVEVTDVAKMKEEIEIVIAQVQMDYYFEKSQNGTVREYVKDKLQEGVQSSTGATISCDENDKILYNGKEVGVLEPDWTVTMNGEAGGAPTPSQKEYTVTYDANGGSSVPASRKYKSGEMVTVDFGTIPTREKYVFQGWARNASATVAEFTNSGNFNISENTTLYAVWTGISGKGTEIVKPAWYGDKVNYSANGVDDWKLFLNDSGRVYLIASDYVPRSKMIMTSDVAVGEGEYGVAGTSQTGLVNWLQTTINWSNLKGTYADSVTGGPTLTQFWASYNGKYGTSYSEERQELSDEIGYNDSLYFSHKEQWNSCYCFWLSTPYSGNDRSIITVDGRGGIYPDGYNDVEAAIRPFVCLLASTKMTWNGTAWDLSV